MSQDNVAATNWEDQKFILPSFRSGAGAYPQIPNYLYSASSPNLKKNNDFRLYTLFFPLMKNWLANCLPKAALGTS